MLIEHNVRTATVSGALCLMRRGGQMSIGPALLHKSGVGWADVYAQRLERWLCNEMVAPIP
uniref:hypothetical protein n=1 Tax=Cupriavidus sp. UYPR2.512 TaxID=1080187 RepID=UPI001E5B2508